MYLHSRSRALTLLATAMIIAGQAYDGKTLRSYDATFDQSSQAPAPAEGHYVPTDWLMPGKIEHLKRHPGWKQSVDQQGNTVLTHIEVLSDDQGEKRTVETEITAQPATGIPVRVIDRLNRQITREITVQNFSLN